MRKERTQKQTQARWTGFALTELPHICMLLSRGRRHYAFSLSANTSYSNEHNSSNSLRNGPYVWHALQLGLKDTDITLVSIWIPSVNFFKFGTNFYSDSNMSKLDGPGQRSKVKYTHFYNVKIIHHFHFLAGKNCVSYYVRVKLAAWAVKSRMFFNGSEWFAPGKRP